MNNVLGNNIARLRKEKKLTQEALAAQLNVSFQAVSKWERGQTYPDIELLAKITEVLETNIDAILDHVPGDAQKAFYYYDLYGQEEFYWGMQPDSMCHEVLKLFPPNGRVKILEIGCGEGKDALFFARNGYDVTAFDIVQAGVDKLSALAAKFHLFIHAFRADMLEYRLKENFDIIYSSRSLHYIKPNLRKTIIDHYKEHTNEGGIHVLNVYVKKSFVGLPPDLDDFSYFWKSGEIFSYYTDWKLESIDEIIYDCNSSGIPHQHVINTIIARKPRKDGLI